MAQATIIINIIQQPLVMELPWYAPWWGWSSSRWWITWTLTDQTDLISKFSLYQLLSEKWQANGYAPLGADSKVPVAYLPSITITDTFVESSVGAMLALTAQTGDVCVRTDESKSYILKWTDPSVLANWTILLNPTSPVQSVNWQTWTVVLTTTDVWEWTSLYHTAARVRSTILTWLSLAAGTIVTAAHTILEAIGFLQNQVSANTTAIATKVKKPTSPVNDAIMLSDASGDAKASVATIDQYGNVTCNSVNQYILYVITTMRLQSVADTVSGSNARMTFPNWPVRRLTNAWLVSVWAMPQWYNDSAYLIQNRTTVSVTFINEDASQTAVERFLTGTWWNYVLPPDAMVWAYYSTTNLRRHLVGTA